MPEASSSPTQTNLPLFSPLRDSPVAKPQRISSLKEVQPYQNAYSKLSQKYLDIIDRGLSEPNIEPLVNEIRKLILLEGLPPPQHDKPKENGLSIRAMVWKILVGVANMDVKEYIELVEKGDN